MKKIIILSLIIFFFNYYFLNAKQQAELIIDFNSSKVQYLNKDVFGTFIEYIYERINGKLGISAQELLDRGFDCDSNNNDFEPQYWSFYNSTNDSSVVDSKISGEGYNKEGWRYYKIVKPTNNGEAGYKQKIFLEANKKYEFYCHFTGDDEVQIYLRLTKIRDNSILCDINIGKITPHWSKISTSAIPSISEQDEYEILIYFKSKGTVNFDESSLLPNDNEYTLRKEVVDMIKYLKPGSIRFPGGCFSDYSSFHWESCVGDINQRAAPNYWWTGTIQRMDFSIDEYMDLCDELSATKYLTLNYGDGTPEEAAAFVEYCNGSIDTKYGQLRAKNGHSEPYNVKYWEVGNEQWSDSQYPKKYLNFYRAIKEVDPSIKVIVNGNHWQGEKDFSKIFPVIGKNADYYSWHPCNVDNALPNTPDSSKYYSMLTWDKITQSDIQWIENALNKYTEKKVRSFPTEWWTSYSPYYTWSYDSCQRDMSLESGLVDAGFIFSWIKKSDKIDIACRTLFMTNLMCKMSKNNKRVFYGTPTYYVHSMMSNHCGNKVLRVNYIGERYNTQPEYNLIDANNIPFLNSVATYTKDSLFIAVINKHISDSINTLIKLPKVKDYLDVKSYQLYSNSYLDMNTADEPTKIVSVIREFKMENHYVFPPHSLTILAIPTNQLDINLINKDKKMELIVNIFPNPADFITYIDVEGDIISSFQLFNESGEEINCSSISIINNDNFIELNTSALSSGIYFIKIYVPNTTIVKKIIVTH